MFMSRKLHDTSSSKWSILSPHIFEAWLFMCFFSRINRECSATNNSPKVGGSFVDLLAHHSHKQKSRLIASATNTTMPVPTPNISRAEKKAAALASARRWQEERKAPLAKITKSPDENPVKIKGTPRRLDKEKALARARERDYEQRKTSPKSIPEAVETRHTKMRRIEVEDLTDNDDDSNALITAARRTTEDLVLVQKAHVKEMLSLKNEIKLAMNKMDSLCESYALDSMDTH